MWEFSHINICVANCVQLLKHLPGSVRVVLCFCHSVSCLYRWFLEIRAGKINNKSIINYDWCLASLLFPQLDLCVASSCLLPDFSGHYRQDERFRPDIWKVKQRWFLWVPRHSRVLITSDRSRIAAAAPTRLAFWNANASDGKHQTRHAVEKLSCFQLIYWQNTFNASLWTLNYLPVFFLQPASTKNNFMQITSNTLSTDFTPLFITAELFLVCNKPPELFIHRCETNSGVL